MQNNSSNRLSALFNMISSSDRNEKRQIADSLRSKLGSQENRELDGIVNNPEKIREILNSPAAAEIMKKINQNKNGNSDGKLK